MEKTLAVFIPIAFFICVTLCVYYVNRFRYEAITKLGGPIPRNPAIKQSWKKIGIVVIGFASGLLATGFAFLWGIINESDWNGLFIVGIVALCTGISVIIADKVDEEEKDNNKDIDG